jgi:DNA-binding CsgD family transcriptional regulator
MLYDINKTTTQFLKNIFSTLNEHKDYVFWIRNRDMSQQIYVSATYEMIWGYSEAILYDIPLIWLSYLAENKEQLFMRRCQERHVLAYEDPIKNLILYQITDSNHSICYLRDEGFKCEGPTRDQYIVGISKRMQEDIWHSQEQRTIYKDDQDKAIFQQFFHLIRENFGIKVVQPIDKDTYSLDYLRQDIANTLNCKFSRRELECLYHLCNGKTAKQTARDMLLSNRTIETYLENIRNKTGSNNKLEVISRFAHYFSNICFPTISKLR